MDDNFVSWFEVRYGKSPTKEQVDVFYKLWKWAKKRPPKHYTGSRKVCLNRHQMKKLKEAEKI